MKIYFNRKKGEYGKNKRSGTQSFTDKFYYFMEKRGHTVTNNLSDDYDIHFSLATDPNLDGRKNRVIRIDGMYSPACGSNFKEMNNPIIESVKRSDYIIFQNKFCKETFDHFAGFTPKRFSLIYNGVDLDIFTPDTNKKFQNNILCYGEVRRENVIMPAVKAIEFIREEIPDAELWIAGGFNEKILSKIPKIDYIRLLGMTVNFGLRWIAEDCSVMAFPAYKSFENNTVSECLACGLPVVCYDSGGTYYKVKDAGIILKSKYCGWGYFPEEDPKEFAKAIIKVLKNKEEYFKKACARREDLSLEKMGEKYLRVFEEVLNES